MRGGGRVVFAATLLLIAGALNIIYGIGAIDGANVLVDEQRYVLDDLNTLGRLLVPAPPKLIQLQPVSTEVNNVRNNGPELIVPLPA